MSTSQFDLLSGINKQSDQYLYLTNCTPTPPQLQSTDNKLGLMLGQGRGKSTVVHILTLIHAYNLILGLNS